MIEQAVTLSSGGGGITREKFKTPIKGNFIRFYGGCPGLLPSIKAFGALDETRALALEADIHQLIHRFNQSSDGTLVLPSEYLEVIIHTS